VALKPEIWGHTATISLRWMCKILELAEQPSRGDSASANHHVHVHICLDVLGYLVTVMPRDTVVASFLPLQKALASCLMCATTTVVRSFYTLLCRLLQSMTTVEGPSTRDSLSSPRFVSPVECTCS